MNKMKVHYIYILIFLLAYISSCKSGTSVSDSSISTDTVTLNNIAVKDTVNTDNNNQNFVVDIKIQYPSSYKGKNVNASLNEAICKRIFSNTLGDYSNAANDLKATYINTFKDAINNTSSIEAEENMPKYEFTFNAHPIFNNGGILSYDVYTYTFIGGTNGDKKNKYFSVDINSSIIELENLFTQDSYDNINALLSEQLKKQLNIKSNDQLIDIGYYDISSITINDNFYVTNEGVVWAYNPCEIACYSIGEVKICLSYKTLKDYLIPNSAISKLIEASNK